MANQVKESENDGLGKILCVGGGLLHPYWGIHRGETHVSGVLLRPHQPDSVHQATLLNESLTSADQLFPIFSEKRFALTLYDSIT